MDDEIKELIVAQGKGFEAFKARYDAELKKEREEREALELRLSKGAPKGGGADTKAIETERKALGAFVRTGDETELKAMSVGSDPDGGYTVMNAMASAIRTKVRDMSPIAGLARRVLLDVGGGDGFSEPFDIGEADAQWVGETAGRPNLTTPNFGTLTVKLHELYTSQPVTQKLLDTGNYDIGAWLENRIADKFARAEGAAFINGNGIVKPAGILSKTISSADDETRAVGALQYVPSGASGAFASSNPANALIDLMTSLRAPYRRNAVWLMNRRTAAVIRKFQDGDGRFVWVDGLAEFLPATLLGHRVELDEEMPDIGANSLSIAFGDFQQGYLIVEQPGIKMLRDPYSSKPNILFYAYRRVGGDVAEAEAIKLMRFSVS